MIFQDRRSAGKQLAEKLLEFKDNPQAIVLGLPRGGVITADEVAKILNLPLDILVTRKIGAPQSAELAIGAITEDGQPILNDDLIEALEIQPEYVDSEIEKQKQEAKRRLEKYRQGRGVLDLKNKIAILVDDGIATGSTMLAAVDSAETKGAAKIIVASPVIAADAADRFKVLATEVVCLDKPTYFEAIGQFYESFEQTTDEEVEKIMKIK